MAKIVDENIDEMKDRMHDVWDHFDKVSKDTIDLHRKLWDSGFKIMKNTHHDIEDRVEKNKKDDKKED